jgi:hypothetical protein
MKFRLGFITNSSSNSYIVRNITDATKTMLDLLREASSKSDGHWAAMPECYGLDEYLDDLMSETHPGDRPEILAQTNEKNPHFLKSVAKVQEFPPNMAVKVTFHWAYVEGYLILDKESESFIIEDVPM